MRFALASLVVVGILVAVYLPDVGHGFVSDDHRWIRESQLAAPADVVRLFRSNVGFYRPVVALTFGVDSRIWGANAFGYGLTNLLLLLANGVLVFVLARHFPLPRSSALVAAAVWLLNFHAVNMATLWLSGRTALLACAFGLPAGLCFLRRRSVGAGVFALLAMLCKEEAVILPALFAAWTWVDRDRLERTNLSSTIVRAAVASGPAWAALAVYAALRAQSGAFGPASAPSYYQFTVVPGQVARNVLEYLDRGATLAAVVALVLAVAARASRSSFAPLDASERRAIAFGAAWFAAWYAITVFLPVRSSLYALIPSVGSALATGALASAAMRRAPRRCAVATVALIAIAIAAVPIYRNRNRRLVAPAELSARVLATIYHQAVAHPEGGRIVLLDDPAMRFNLQGAFGSLFPDAVAMWIGPGWTGEIVDRIPSPPPTTGTTLVFHLSGDNVVPQVLVK